MPTAKRTCLSKVKTTVLNSCNFKPYVVYHKHTPPCPFTTSRLISWHQARHARKAQMHGELYYINEKTWRAQVHQVPPFIQVEWS